MGAGLPDDFRSQHSVNIQHLNFKIKYTWNQSKANCTLARRGAVQLNKTEIKEVVHCLYICAARQLAVRCGFFYLENFLIFSKTARLFLLFP